MRTLEKDWEMIVSYMDDDLREELHMEMAPCRNIDFLKAYIQRDPDFEDFLNNELSIDMNNIYTREMLSNDYREEAANYISVGFTPEEIAQDVKESFSDCYVEDSTIISDYITRLLEEIDRQR